MIGITIVTHRQLGDALIDAAGFILGHQPEAVVSVSIDKQFLGQITQRKIYHINLLLVV